MINGKDAINGVFTQTDIAGEIEMSKNEIIKQPDKQQDKGETYFIPDPPEVMFRNMISAALSCIKFTVNGVSTETKEDNKQDNLFKKLEDEE